MKSVREVGLMLVRSRLVQFLAVGALLAIVAPKEPDARAIVLTQSRIEASLQAERLRRGRELTVPEKNGVVSDLVDDEVLAREALRLNLGTDDEVVRARLAERMAVSYASALPRPRLDETEVNLAVAQAIERAPVRVRLAVWFVAREKTGAANAAEAIAKAITSDGIEKARGKGDRSALPDNALWTEDTLARVVGPPVAKRAIEAEVGKPTEPLPSAWGFFVFVPLERRAATPDEVRAGAVAKLVESKQAAEVKRIVHRARHDFSIELRSPDGEPRFDIDGPQVPPTGPVD